MPKCMANQPVIGEAFIDMIIEMLFTCLLLFL